MDEFIRFSCPACDKTLKAQPEHAGRKANCSCGHVLTIPAPPAASAPAEPTATGAQPLRKLRPWLAAGAGVLLLTLGIAWMLGVPARKPTPPAEVAVHAPEDGSPKSSPTSPLPGALLLFGIGFGCTLLLSVLTRLANGARPDELVHSRGYELPPIRGLIHVGHLFLWALLLVAGWTALAAFFGYFDNYAGRHLLRFFAALGAGLGLALAVWACWRWLVQIERNPPPSVDVTNVEMQTGIPRQRLERLGQERFPNTLVDGWKAELWLRGGLAFLCGLFIVLVLYGSTDGARTQGWRQGGVGVIDGLRSTLILPSSGLGLFLAASCGIALLLLAYTNRTYTLLTFPQTLGVVAALVLGVFAGLATLGWSPEGLALLLALIALVCAVRWVWDVKRGIRYQRMKVVYDRLAGAVREAVSGLPELARRPDCQLTPVAEAHLGQRISQGCRNVEEADPLVTRNFARFMSLVTVESEHFVAAMLRYLTVRRYVTESGGLGTLRWLQDPVVPEWDEGLFPLHPPTGYVDWIDPLGLGPEWDRVSICYTCLGTGQMVCPTCGGSGRVRHTETWTENSGGQTVTRTREVENTCSGCGGSGRITCTTCGGLRHLEFKRTLNTQWQRLLPAVVAPEVPMPELLEDAEERVYYRLPLIEDRVSLDERGHTDRIGPDLAATLEKAGQRLAEQHRDHADQVIQLHDGRYLYRADFQVTGFWTLCIHFRRLRGRLGWFFGARPEFYFPWLPLSWSMVGTLLFLPPLAVILALLAARAFWGG